jgi:uncharacterized protein CbrC (UPF0167 family)
MKRKTIKQFKIDTLICTCCEEKMYVPRMAGHYRKRGHIKDMYCPRCKAKRKFIEQLADDFVRNMDGEFL